MFVQNPFLEDLIVPTYWRVNSWKGSGLTCNTFEVDISPYVKVFPTILPILLNSTYSQRVIVCAILNRISIRFQEYLDLRYASLGLSKSTFHNAISELIELGLLCKRDSRSGTYWLNPNMLFHGNRVEKYKFNTEATNENPLANVKLDDDKGKKEYDFEE